VAPAIIEGTVINSHFHYLLLLCNTSNHCTSLNYTLHSKNQKETLKLTVEHSPANDGSFYHDFRHPIVTVSLLLCPWGFTLQPDSLYCDCNSQLVSYKILCNINYQTIERAPPVWIGHYSTQLNSSNSTLARGCTVAKESECQGIVIHPNCPYDYCISTKINISLNSTDKQCAFHRIHSKNQIVALANNLVTVVA